MLKEPIWTEQPDILYRGRRLTLFVPRPDHTDEERFNALTRFFIIFGLVLMIYRRSFFILIPCCVLPIILLIFLSEQYIPPKECPRQEVVVHDTSAESNSLSFMRHMMTPIDI